MPLAVAIALLAVWVVPIGIFLHRARGIVSLEQFDATPPHAAPRVSVILPARNEARHIADCVRTIRASTWPDLELIVVDDHSTDGTGTLAREAAAGDPRVHVIEAPDLPPGWFGKQWACAAGAAHATGALLLFTDADTRHAPDLLARAVAARAARGARLLSVAGAQTMHTIWERAIQPVVFVAILSRYGSTRQIETARTRRGVIANGQCFLIDRPMYDAIGGHAAVHDTVAEDLMIGQEVHAAGGRVSIALGQAQLSTRMYASLGEIIRGWSKNLFAGGRLAMPGGRVGQWIFPLLLLAYPLLLLAPFVALPAALAGTGTPGLLLWAAGATIALLALWILLLGAERRPRAEAALLPLGALLLLAIVLRALARGSRVEWKGREYRSR
jgi:chlorobactene glucosyltransferase